MPKRPPVYRPSHARTARQVDADRGTFRERGYSAAWDRASAAHRAKHPLCAYCELEDRVTPCQLTDHLYPHRVYRGVFWLSEYWVSACHDCHNGFKQRIERAGRAALDALARQLGLPPLPADHRG